VQVRRAGTVLLTDALVTQRMRVAGVDHVSRWRESNALVRAGGRWRIAQHSATPMAALAEFPVAPSAIPDSATLADFVGDYEGWPGVVDRITQRGARLFIQDPARPNDPPYPLVAAGAEAFYPLDDSLGLLVFARDATGRVTHYVTRNEGGPVVVARKIR
jgi:hypothetical protein